MVREIQIKTIMRYHLIPSEWPLSKNLKTISVGDSVGKSESFYTVGGDVNWYKHYGEEYGGSLKNEK